MHRKKAWSQSGVSEVIGTILILLMTVILFSTVIVWVTSIPTPQATIRLDMNGALIPIYNGAGAWTGANITVDHRGGESLQGFRTNIFFTVTNSTGTIKNAILKTRGPGPPPYGIDGPDTDWDAGERWSYTNYSVLATDKVRMTVIDTARSLVLWTEALA